MNNNAIYQERIDAIRQQFDEWEVEGVLIDSEANRRWLSGFTGSAGQLLITANSAWLATDFRYWEQAVAQAPDFTLFKHKRTNEDNAAFFATAGVARIGVEARHMTLAERAKLSKIEGVTWTPLKQTAESLRQIKSQAEIDVIQAAAAITDEVMGQVNTLARPGLSERALAWELEKMMREAGAEGMAFDVIVASGPNTALPHHSPGDRRLQAGDPIILDMGARIAGYHSDLTRSFYLGKAPDERYETVYGLVLAAQTAVLDQIKPGLTSKEADALARDLIAAAEQADYFGHGLGHAVGLAIHEEPFLSPRADEAPIAAGMVLTVEPGIYIPGWGGVRIEDLIVVTADGCQCLSHCPKTPMIFI